MTAPEITLFPIDGGAALVVRPARLIVAGYTGRDEAAVRAHIDELAAAGIAPPPSVPTFYDLDPALLTTEAIVPVGAGLTSGEVEPVLVRAAGRWYLGVGSDHTDRDLERVSVAASKAACPKPIGRYLCPLEDGLDALDWDATEASSCVDGERYQRGSLAGIRPARELWRLTSAALPELVGDVDLVLFCGTLPLLAGHFVKGVSWQVQLRLPAGLTLAHTYQTLDRST